MRFLKLVTITLLAGVVIAAIAILPARLCFNDASAYTFFCGDTSKNCREISTKDNADLLKLTLSDVCGESAVYDELDVGAFLKSVNGKIIFTETLSDSVNYYCTASLPYSVKLYGEEINLHICVKAASVTVASPIIFGGY
ncbi:MAG: hypothetical protein K2N22_06170 [Clostridia bacterium]|nr:hypothetical protein [Clostridia bacterium]